MIIFEKNKSQLLFALLYLQNHDFITNMKYLLLAIFSCIT